MTRVPEATPLTHMSACSSSITDTGTNCTASSASTARTPKLPLEEKVSAERGTRVAGCGSMRSATSAVMPSGMAPSAFGISTSTR
jgi:hypothetical protein